MKCKGISCPLNIYCSRYDKVETRTIGKHYPREPFRYNHGKFVCDKYIGETSRYLFEELKSIIGGSYGSQRDGSLD